MKSKRRQVSRMVQKKMKIIETCLKNITERNENKMKTGFKNLAERNKIKMKIGFTNITEKLKTGSVNMSREK